MGPFFLTDLLGLDTVLHVAEHLHESYGDSFYVHEGMRALVEARRARREDRQGLLRERRAAHGGRDRVRRRRADAALRAEGVRRGVPGARGRHGDRARHRPRHDGRRRHDPAAVRARRPDRPGRRARAARDRGRRVGRALRAAADPAPARRAGAPRREDRPGLLRLRAARRAASSRARRSSSRRATSVAIAWMDRPPANSLSPQVIAELDAPVGARRRRRVAARAHHRLGQPDAVVRGRGHQGLHEAGRRSPARRCSTTRTRCCAAWSAPRR